MSVRKREWVTATGEKKEAWNAFYYQNGVRHLRTFALKRDADAFHSSVNVEVKLGLHTPTSRSVTVAAAGERWLATCATDQLERATIDTYRQHYQLHILPFLGDAKLSTLTVAGVRDFMEKLRKGGRSPVMVKRVMISLGSLLADAQEQGLVAQNVVRSLRANRRRKKGGRAQQTSKLKVGVDIPSPTEIKAIVAQLKGRWRPLLLTAIFTGLRASELRGLRWVDVDLKKGELHVNQRADRYNTIGKPKSESGERTVPLGPVVVNALREWKMACPNGKLDLVFPNGKGNIENHQNILNRGFFPAQIAAGVTDGKGGAKYTGLHSLRHFYASWCMNRKADGGLELPLKLVQSRLGHATISMTSDRYGHLFERGDDGSELAAGERAVLG